MAKLPQRIFAMMFAVIFFVSTVAFAIFVIIDAVQSNKNAAQDADTASQANCQPTDSGEPTLAAPKVHTVSSKVVSLQTTDLASGTGTAAKAGDCLVMKYYGTIAKTGKVFDQNYTDPTAFAFTLGQGEVIQGWDQALVGMKPGGVRQIVVPAALAYGSASPSKDIPANSDLVFEAKLLRIQQ